MLGIPVLEKEGGLKDDPWSVSSGLELEPGLLELPPELPLPPGGPLLEPPGGGPPPEDESGGHAKGNGGGQLGPVKVL